MRSIIIFIFFLNLFYLSYEALELPLFEQKYFSVSEKTEEQIYLNTSIYNIGDKINISIEVAMKRNIYNFYCNSVFYNSLDFSKVYTQYSSRLSKQYDYSTGYYHYTAYYDFIKPNNNRYLLFVFNKYHLIGAATIYHLNRPNSTSIELKQYSSLIVNSSTYVYQNNTYYNKNNIYFSFSFYFENITEKLAQFEIYYGLDNYRDDKTFKHLYKTILKNPRIKNNNYTFYFNFPLKENKPYICLIPGKINNQIYTINITQLVKLPVELREGRHIIVNSDDYIYFNINKYMIGSELFLKIMLTKTNLDNLMLYYKYSHENFYEDFMNYITQPNAYIYHKQIDDNKINTSFYFNIKLEKKENFILFQIPQADNIDFTFFQTKENEYEKIQKEKRIKLTLIIIPSIIMIINIILIILLITKSIKKKKTINKNNINFITEEQYITYEKGDNSYYPQDNNDTPSAPTPFDPVNFKNIN